MISSTFCSLWSLIKAGNDLLHFREHTILLFPHVHLWVCLIITFIFGASFQRVGSLLLRESKLWSFCGFSFLQLPPHIVPFTPTAEVLRVSFLVFIFIALSFSSCTVGLNRKIASMWIDWRSPSTCLGNHPIYEPALVLTPIASLWLPTLQYFNYEMTQLDENIQMPAGPGLSSDGHSGLGRLILSS